MSPDEVNESLTTSPPRRHASAPIAGPQMLKGSFEGREAGSGALEGALQTPGEVNV